MASPPESTPKCAAAHFELIRIPTRNLTFSHVPETNQFLASLKALVSVAKSAPPAGGLGKTGRFRFFASTLLWHSSTARLVPFCFH